MCQPGIEMKCGRYRHTQCSYSHLHVCTHTRIYHVHTLTFTTYTHSHSHAHTHTHTHTHTTQASLWYEGRRLVLSSEEFPLSHAHPSRLSSMKTPPKFYLFDDAFVTVQVCNTRKIYCYSWPIFHF